ncbi:MAG: hypothetical protein IKZ04_02745 [Spirochaetaceae bacterium]|nr:hypothetical protein [Spirochaetaceae bacterium]
MLFVRSDWFKQMVKDKWNQLKQKNILEQLTAQIDYFTNSYADKFESNYNRWDNIGNNETVGYELCDDASKCKSQKESAVYLKSWLEKRFNNLDILFESLN